MNHIFYYNNKLYSLFLSIVFVVLCFTLSFAENYLIPPSHREMDGIKEYLNNDIEQEDVTEELLGSAEDFCLEKIDQHEDVTLYRSQLLKICFDRIFLRNFNNPVWVEKHIERDKTRLALIEDQKEKDKLTERIEKYEQRLDILEKKTARNQKVKKILPINSLAVMPE